MAVTEIVFFANTDPRFREAQAIRRAVFVDEQKCPVDEEWDDKDDVSTHFLALRDGAALGTLRSFDEGGWYHIGRLAVVRSARGMGIGGELLAAALREAKRNGYSRAFLNAQIDKRGFYERFGFVAVGDEFMEAGIRHKRMEALRLP